MGVCGSVDGEMGRAVERPLYRPICVRGGAWGERGGGRHLLRLRMHFAAVDEGPSWTGQGPWGHGAREGRTTTMEEKAHAYVYGPEALPSRSTKVDSRVQPRH